MLEEKIKYGMRAEEEGEEEEKYFNPLRKIRDSVKNHLRGYTLALGLVAGTLVGCGIDGCDSEGNGSSSGQDEIEDGSQQDDEDPCENYNGCRANSHCVVNEDNNPPSAACQCNAGFEDDGQGNCLETIDPPSPCLKPLDVCTGSYTLDVCLTAREAQCLGTSTIEALCPSEFSRCEEGATEDRCQTLLEMGHMDFAPPERETRWCYPVNRFDLVEDQEDNESLRDFRYGLEQEGTLDAAISCGENYGSPLSQADDPAERPLQSYTWFSFNMHWCRFDRPTEYIVRVQANYPDEIREENGETRPLGRLTVEPSGESYELVFKEAPCNKEFVAHLEYISSSPIRFTLEGPEEGYIVPTVVELVACVYD